MPDDAAKLSILNAMLRKTKVDSALDLSKLANSAACAGFSGADLKGLVQIATGISTRQRISRSEELRASIMNPFYAAKAAAAAGEASAAAAAKTAGDGGATGMTADVVAEEKVALQRAADAVNAECGAGNWTGAFIFIFSFSFVFISCESCSQFKSLPQTGQFRGSASRKLPGSSGARSRRRSCGSTAPLKMACARRWRAAPPRRTPRRVPKRKRLRSALRSMRCRKSLPLEHSSTTTSTLTQARKTE